MWVCSRVFVFVIMVFSVGFTGGCRDLSPSVGISVDGAQKREVLLEPPVSLIKALPDFKRFTDIKSKKTHFFAFLLPMVEQENALILRQREKLLVLKAQFGQGVGLSPDQLFWLSQLAEAYELSGPDNRQLIGQLLTRVDMVPVSLALSQAANESAWGTSRFATQGNNLFGQWCFKAGCGLVPRARSAGMHHEVARFGSPALSVAGYIHNLNTNKAYHDFRVLRASLRQLNLPLTGLRLAKGLKNYSSRGDDYIRELTVMIKVNHLLDYDT